MTSCRLMVLPLLVGLLAGCSDSAGPYGDWERQPGRLYPELSSTQMLQMPAQATAGVAFQITVTTRGSGSCTKADGMTVSVSGMVADVTPWDRVAPGGTPCTDDLMAFPRTATVRFDSPGTATIRLHGRNDLVYEASLMVTAAG